MALLLLCQAPVHGREITTAAMCCLTALTVPSLGNTSRAAGRHCPVQRVTGTEMHAQNGNEADDTFPDIDPSSLLVESAASYALTRELRINPQEDYP